MPRDALLVILVAVLAWGTVIFNGAGFSLADDLYAMDGNSQRPLLKFTYDLNARYGGWMLTNVALHAGAALALLCLVGVWPAVLFAAHPIAGDAVASVAGRSSLLCAALVLAALLAYKHRMHYATAGLVLLAFMTKEEAVVLGVLLPLCAWIWDRRRQALLLLAACATLTLAAVPGILGVARVAGVEQTLIDIGIKPPLPYVDRVIASFSAIGSEAMPALMLPLWLGVEPDATYSEIGVLLAYWTVLLSLAVFWLVPQWRLAVALMITPLVAYLPVGLNDPFFEHRAYLAAAGVACLVPKRLRWLTLVVFLVIANQRAYVYGSPRRLWAEAVRQHPTSVRARINLGMILWAEDDQRGAEEQFKQAIPSKAAYTNLAGLYMSQGDLSHASVMMDLMEGR